MINNENKFKSLEQLRRLLIFLSAVGIVAWAYWGTSLPAALQYLSVAVIVITLLLIVYHAIVGFAFFMFEEVGDVLIFKYYKTGDFSFKRMKISVSHADFAGFELRKSFFNMRNELIIHEVINGRKATYPPLNISSLSAQQQKELIDRLRKHAGN